MHNAFVNPQTGVLKAFGYVATNAPGDMVVPVPDDFSAEPGTVAYVGGQWVAYTPPASAGQVVAERERRLGLGFNFDFADARGVHRIGTSPADMVGWDEVSKFAAALLATGDTATRINIVTNTGATYVTSQDWQHVLVAAGNFRQPIWAASFMLEAQNPIPLDYAADAHWPAVQ